MKTAFAVGVLFWLISTLTLSLASAIAGPKPPTAVAWPAVGQSLQYLAAPGVDPQAALITGVPRPPSRPTTATTFPLVQVVVFPATGASFAATAGYCAETGYPCLVPLP